MKTKMKKNCIYIDTNINWLNELEISNIRKCLIEISSERDEYALLINQSKIFNHQMSHQ